MRFITRGSFFTRRVVLKNSRTGIPINLAGGRFRAQLSLARGAPELLTLTTEDGGIAVQQSDTISALILSMSSYQTSLLEVGTILCDLFQVTADNQHIVHFSIVVREPV